MKITITHSPDCDDSLQAALECAMGFARGTDPRVADRFVGMWVNDMTVEIGERG